jgi:uncharacterized protein YkwD
MRTFTGLAALLTVVALLGRPVLAEAYLTADETRSGQLVESARASAGVGGLVRRADLDQIARAQAVRMAAADEIFHNPHLAADADSAGLPWLRLGENVGVGPDVEAIHNAFMASPHHRENILDPRYTAIGVGIVQGLGSDSDRIFVAHVFADLVSPPKSTAAVPARPHSVAAVHAVPPTTRTVVAPPRASPAPNAILGGVVDRTELID